MKPRIEYVYASALLISILQIVIYFTNLECEVEGWGKESIRNISLYISDVNAQIFPKDFCQAYSMLLIVVCSAPANTNARQAVRETWGSQKTVLGERIELVFLMGKALEPSVQGAILAESQQFNDIIQEDFTDSYYNLTLKSTLMLKLASSNCMDMSRFLFKIDDDMFVNIPKLMRLLIERNNSENVLLGKMMCRTQPIKDPTSKWYCPAYMFNNTYFPNFLSGTGYLMSLDVTKKLYNAALTIPLIHLEDVYITGMCAKNAGIVPETVFEFSTGYFEDESCELKNLITIHYFTPDRMRQTFQTLNKPGSFEKCHEPIFKPTAWLRTTLFLPLARSRRKRIC